MRIWIEIYFREHDVTTKIQWDLKLQKQKYKHSVDHGNGRDLAAGQRSGRRSQLCLLF